CWALPGWTAHGVSYGTPVSLSIRLVTGSTAVVGCSIRGGACRERRRALGVYILIPLAQVGRPPRKALREARPVLAESLFARSSSPLPFFLPGKIVRVLPLSSTRRDLGTCLAIFQTHEGLNIPAAVAR